MLLTPNITLRQAVPGDWPAISALLEANRLPLEGALEHLRNYLVAVANGEVVGSAGAEQYGNVALVRSVAVAPGLHKRGVGRQMVERLIEESRRRQIAALYLLTATAPEYFARYGFRRTERAQAPAAVRNSAEFRGACPDSAAFMVLRLVGPARSSDSAHHPVAVLGAGPVGLAAAAKLVEQDIPFIVLEAAPTVGASLLDYGHVRLFSPWRFDIDPSMRRLLKPTGWQAPPEEELPLAAEIVERVLKPFAALPRVAAALQLGTRVTAVTREGHDKVKSAGRDKAPFLIRAERDGRTIELRARAIIDSTGTWSHPNPLGANGLPAIGEAEAADRIAYGIPDVLGHDRARYAGRRTLVVGAGHSAANALLYLAELAKEVPGTRLAWAVRTPILSRVFGGGGADALPARGQLGASLRSLRDGGGLEFVAGLRIREVGREADELVVSGLDAEGRAVRMEGIDEIICATGQRPDLSLTSELRVKLDPWLESTEALGPLIDPNVHSCGTVRPHGHRELAHPEPGLYTVGVKSYGRAPTFLMATGFEQVRSVVAAIAGDLAAADRVELDLPETGVCGIGEPDEIAVASAPAAASVTAKSRKGGGCGTSSCGTTAAPEREARSAARGKCCGPASTPARSEEVATRCCG